MPIYPYSFQLPPLNVQDIPNDGAPGEFLGISAGGVLDWLPAGGGGSGDMLAANNLSELTNFATARTNIGLGTTSTPTFANLTLTSPSLSTSAPVTISQTWDNAAVAFTGLKFNAAGTSGTNSAAASKLLDLQVGGVSKFSVDKSGIIALPQTGGDASALICGGSVITNAAAYIGIYGIRLDSTSALQWSSGKNLNILDTILLRDGEGTDHLAMRRSTNGQKFSVYGTYPGANWERFTITAPTSGNVLLGTYKGTGGIARGLEFQTGGVTRMTISATGGLSFNNNGTTDASSGIGSWYLTTTGVQVANTASFRWNGDVGISRNASGVAEINSTTAGTFRDLRVRSVIQQLPITTTITPDSNGDFIVEATSNTTLTFKLKGTDGTVRSGTITLSV